MSSLDFQVKKVYPGTPNQRNAGIYATFGIDIIVDDTVIASLSDYKLCKSREGEMYVQSPYREYEKKGDSTGAKQKIYFAKLFPNSQDNTHMKAIIQQVQRACEANANKPPQTSGAPRPTTYNRPPAKPTSNGSSANLNDW